MNTKLIEINTKADRLRFVKSLWSFYKGDTNFVSPIIVDRMKLIDTEKNAFYQHAKIKMFAVERNGTIVGRIAAITNQLHNEIHKDKVGSSYPGRAAAAKGGAVRPLKGIVTGFRPS